MQGAYIENKFYSNFMNMISILYKYITAKPPSLFLLLVARILESGQREELLLDSPWAGEPQKNVGATCLIVGATGTATTERLLANQRSRSLAVYEKVSKKLKV